PGALTGTAQVIASFLRSGATGWTLPTQTSSAKTAPVASSFMPLIVTPASSSLTPRRAVIGQQILGEGAAAAGGISQRLGLQRHPGDEARDMVGRAAHQPVARR